MTERECWACGNDYISINDDRLCDGCLADEERARAVARDEEGDAS